MRRVVVLLVALVVPLVLATPATLAKPMPPPVDWRTVVDFTGTGLDPTSPADAALLEMLEPARIKNPTDRAAYQRQLDGLVGLQASVRLTARRAGLSDAAVRQRVTKVASPYGVQTIDPGCQLTSSNPGGYDLCAYDSLPDTMSQWACSPNNRKHQMWTGIQEIDAPEQFRGWYKSQALGCQGTQVDHTIDTKGFEVWSGTSQPGSVAFGPTNPAIDNCLPLCYGTGSPHLRLANIWYGDKIVRDYVEIHGTSSISTTDNTHYSLWWDRDGCACSFYPGPNNYVP